MDHWSSSPMPEQVPPGKIGAGKLLSEMLVPFRRLVLGPSDLGHVGSSEGTTA